MAIITNSNQYKYTGRGPLDAKTLVKTFDDLLLESTWQITTEGTPLIIAYNGMITSVWKDRDPSKNGVYVLHDPNATVLRAPVVTNEANWHKIAKVADLASFVEKLDLFESQLKTVADVELFQKITSIDELPTAADYTADTFNPNIVYYTYNNTTEKLITYIYVKDLPGYKRVTGDSSSASTGRSISKVEINEAGELVIYYSDNTISNVGSVVGRDGDITAIQIGDTRYVADVNGAIVLPNLATVEYVDTNFATKTELQAYATKTHVEDRIEDSFDQFTESLKTITLYGGDANPTDDE